jgi:hypothetical protein
MVQMLVSSTGEILLADVAPPPHEDPPGSTETPPQPPPAHTAPISTAGLIAIAIAVFALVFIGLKLRSKGKTH